MHSDSYVSVDRYGGSRQLRGESTGWFHLEVIQDQHCLVTPEGGVMIALGLNHCDLAAVDLSQAAGSAMVTAPPAQQAAAVYRDWGFNSGPYDNPNPLADQIPYTIGFNATMASAWRADEFNYCDVFDSAVLNGIDQAIKRTCVQYRNAENANLICYFQTDIPCWDLRSALRRRGENWLTFIRQLPPDAPGRLAYARFLADRYEGNSDKFNAVYGTSINTFNELATTALPGIIDYDKQPAIESDDDAFLVLIARQLYQFSKSRFDKYDPNHLLLTDRFEQSDHPRGVLAEAVAVADALAIQPTDAEHFDIAYFDQLHATTGKPIFIADHVFALTTEQYPVTLGQALPDPQAYESYYRQFLTDAFNRPYIIGYNQCQFVSRFCQRRQLLKQGILDPDGQPMLAIKPAVQRVNRDLLMGNLASG